MGFADDDDDLDEYSSEEMTDDYEERANNKYKSSNARESTRANRYTGIPCPEICRPGEFLQAQTGFGGKHPHPETSQGFCCRAVSFEEAQGIANTSKPEISILNLERTDPNLSRRLVDFISGTTYAYSRKYAKSRERHLFVCSQ
jgi:cell division inhibitor SepF